MTPPLSNHLDNYLAFYYEYLPQIRAAIQDSQQQTAEVEPEEEGEQNDD